MKNELKSWADLSNRYSMVLFNKCTEVGEEHAVLYEYMDNHTCDAKDAGYHIESCETKDCATCKEHKSDYGEYPECECEPCQWYAISVGEYDVEYLNKEFNLNIFYSDTLDLYILPVYHFGTGWSIMGLKGGYVNV